VIEKLLVSTHLCHFTILYYGNRIRVLDGGKPVRNCDAAAAFGGFVYCSLDHAFRLSIYK
jgi:hypothetical protein